LRWEAALQEMELYYAVPKPFRDRLKEDFGHELNARIAQATCLELLSVTGPPQPTIFGLILKNEKGPLPADIVANIYHALRRGESAGDSESHPCLLGQPVALPAQRTSALRISLSARLIRQCWSPDARQAMRNRAVLFENLALAVNRLDHQARQINRSLELV
jgi:hypothetical protein